MKHTVAYVGGEPQGKDTHLVLMLHGYGAHERDLLQIGQQIGGDITWAGMRAPQPVGASLTEGATDASIPGKATGYQWFPFKNQNLDADFTAVELAVRYVLDFLDAEADSYRSISLFGFSQGMALATTIARHQPQRLRSLMGLSGYVIDQESDYLQDRQLAATDLPIFYGRGDADPVIPAPRVTFTESFLQKHSAVESHVYAGMPHSICGTEVSHLAAFVQKNILGKN